LNVSYDTSKISFGVNNGGEMELIRKWYADVYVNDTNGYLENANVNVTNVTSNNVFSGLTNATGQIARQELIEYITNVSQSGTSTIYHTSHAIVVDKAGVSNSTTYNLTEEQNIEHYVTLPIEEIISCRELNVTGKVYLLENDITGIEGTCFNITANNITLDFNGYNITGNGSGYGVYVNEPDNLIIENGEIYNFSYGIYLYNSDYSMVNNNTIKNATLYGMYSIYSDYNNITNNTFYSDNYYSFRGHDLNGGIIQNNSFKATISGGSCLYGEYITRLKILDNYLDVDPGIWGIRLQTYSNHNTIDGNNLIASASGANTDGIFLNSYCENNTIKNNYIENTQRAGVYLNSNAVRNILINNTIITTRYWGVLTQSSSDHNIFINNSFDVGAEYAYYIRTDNNTFINNTAKSSPIGFYLNYGDYNRLINCTSESNNHGLIITFAQGNNITGYKTIGSHSGSGISIYNNATDNYFSDFEINNIANGNSIPAGIRVFNNGSNNVFEDGYINDTGIGAGIRIGFDCTSYAKETNSHNIFRNIWINNTAVADIYYIINGTDSRAINNTFVNVSFNSSDVSFDNCTDGGDMEFIRKWWGDIYVNDSSGYLEGASVSGYDIFGSLDDSSLTDASGYTQQELTEYIINASQTGTTTTYHTTHTINASKDYYGEESNSYNLTTEQNIEHHFVLSAFPETTTPVITPVSPYSNETLNCSATYFDAELDTGDVNLTWYNDDEIISSTVISSLSNGTLVSTTLDDSNFVRGDTIICSARANNGGYGSWKNSTSKVILSNDPSVSLISPENYTSIIDRTPSFTWSSSDPEEDNLVYQINITCYHTSGGGCSDDNRLVSGISELNYIVTNPLKYISDNGYYYNWSVRASDNNGVDYGNWSSIWKLDVESLVLITLTNDLVDFGSLDMTGNNDTTDNSPNPFVIENNGNCMANLTVNATSLWNSIVDDSSYYQFKIDDKIGEEGSFNWGDSITSWTNIPITGSAQLAIVELNWSNVTDSAEIDLKIVVPSQESAGDRESNVYITASLGE